MAEPTKRWKPDPAHPDRNVLTLDSIRAFWTYYEEQLQLPPADLMRRLGVEALPADVVRVANERLPDDQNIFRQGMREADRI